MEIVFGGLWKRCSLASGTLCFVEYFACETWADYLRRFDRFTAADEELQKRRHSFHIAEGKPRLSRFLARHPKMKARL